VLFAPYAHIISSTLPLNHLRFVLYLPSDLGIGQIPRRRPDLVVSPRLWLGIRWAFSHASFMHHLRHFSLNQMARRGRKNISGRNVKRGAIYRKRVRSRG
jgi:hypothetical protein